MKKAIAVLALMALSAPTYAALIDFESMPGGMLPSYTEQGVTFTAIDGTTVTSDLFGNTPNGTKGVINAELPFAPIEAVIAGGADFVSVDLGDFNGDFDFLFLRAFDASDVLIGSDTQAIAADFVGMVTLSVAAADIASVTFGAVLAVDGSSVYADNFVFERRDVPAPATLALLGLGLVGFGMRRRSC